MGRLVCGHQCAHGSAPPASWEQVSCRPDSPHPRSLSVASSSTHPCSLSIFSQGTDLTGLGDREVSGNMGTLYPLSGLMWGHRAKAALLWVLWPGGQDIIWGNSSPCRGCPGERGGSLLGWLSSSCPAGGGWPWGAGEPLPTSYWFQMVLLALYTARLSPAPAPCLLPAHRDPPPPHHLQVTVGYA